MFHVKLCLKARQNRDPLRKDGVIVHSLAPTLVKILTDPQVFGEYGDEVAFAIFKQNPANDHALLKAQPKDVSVLLARQELIVPHGIVTDEIIYGSPRNTAHLIQKELVNGMEVVKDSSFQKRFTARFNKLLEHYGAKRFDRGQMNFSVALPELAPRSFAATRNEQKGMYRPSPNISLRSAANF